jgi:PAS domain S-box-containing protein
MGGDPEPANLLAAFARASDGVFAVDQAMRIVYWNDAASRIFRTPASEALGARCDEVVAGLDSTGARLCAPDCKIVACARRGHASATYDLVRPASDGERQWLNVSIVVLRGRRRASTLAVHLVRDVTDRRAVELRSQRLLSRLDRRPSATAATITRREAEVLRLLASGASNASIADTLGLSVTTVRNHIEHLLAKLGVHSKLEAVVEAARTGLL